MHAVLHDATEVCQLVGVAGPDATATVGLTASAVSDANDDVEHDATDDDAEPDATNDDDAEHDATDDDAEHDVTDDDAEHDAVATMSLRCHLPDYAATAVTIHV